MTSVAATLLGCPGLSVGVHHYNNNTGIGAPFWQTAGPPIPGRHPMFNKLNYLISEEDAQFVAVVHVDIKSLPIDNILIGEILSVALYLDGFHVSTFLWDTGTLTRSSHVSILASPVNPATNEVKLFKFTEPTSSLDNNNNNNEPNQFLGTIEVVISHARGHVDPQGLPLTVNHARPFPNNSAISYGPRITPHVITYHRRTQNVAAPAGMTKTATIGQSCSFEFKYGPRGYVEYWKSLHTVTPGDGDRPGTAPPPASRRPPPPPQAVRDNTYQDVVAARPRQNAPEGPSLVNATYQMLDVLRTYARDYAAHEIRRAVLDGDMFYAVTPRGPPAAGPSNVSNPQNRPASMAQPHHGAMGMGMAHQQGPPSAFARAPDGPRGTPVAGLSNPFHNQNQVTPMGQPHYGGMGMGMGMGYQQGPPPVTGQPPGTPRGLPVAGPSHFFHNQYQPAPMAQPDHSQMGHYQGPPPATAQPPNTGRTRAGEIDELRQFSDGVRFIRRLVTGYAGLPLTSASSNGTPAFASINAGLPLPPAPPNITPGITAINAGLPLTSTSPSITPGFTSINAGSTVHSIGAGPGSGRLGREGRRLLAAQRLRDAQTGDSLTSARDCDNSTGPASTAIPQVGESRRRAAQLGDSLTSVRNRDHSAGRAVTATTLEGESRRRHAAPLAGLNVLAESVSVSIDGGVHVNRPANRSRAARIQQGSAATSITGRLPDGLHRTQENIVAMTSSNVANSARTTVTSPDPTHTAASAGNVPIPVTATASAALASGSDDSDAPLAQTYARRGANRGAVAEGVTHGASAGEGAANATKVDGQDGSTGTTTLPVNTTAESGSEGDHSPPHKKHKVNGGDSGGTTGDKDA